MASKVTRPSPCADGQVLKYNATSGLFECQDDLGGGSGGDNISINGASATDADFDNATPAAPANAVNVRWQKDALTPNNLSAHLLFSDLGTTTFGSGSGFTWTFNASAGTDPALTFGDGVFNLSTGTLQQGGTPVVLRSRQILSGNGLSGGGDLSTDRTLALALLAVQDGVGAPSTNSGLEFAGASSDKLAILQGCANGQLLKWTASGGSWGCANDNDSGAGTAAWEGLVNTADTATSYTSNNTAETVTFSFESNFGASQQFLIRQQTGNPTAGTLLDVRAADTNVTVLRAGDGTNGITVSQAGALTAEGSGSITATLGDSATAFFAAGQVEAARGGTGINTSGSTGVPRIAAGSWSADATLNHLQPALTAATLFTSDATAETFTWSAESAFSSGDQFLVRQQTGNPTGGTLAAFRSADAQLNTMRIQNTAALDSGKWDLHVGDDRSGFSTLTGGTYLDPAENIAAYLNRASANKAYAFSAVMQDNTTNPIFGSMNAVESTHTAGTRNDATGVEGDAYHTGAGTTSVLAGVAAYSQVDAGSVTSAVAFNAFGVPVNNTSSVTEAIGLHVGSHSKAGGASLGQAFGIKIEAQTAATTNYAIFTVGTTQSLFGGQICTGTTSTCISESAAGVLNAASVVSPSTGFRINGAATTGRYLRGNGSNFVQSSGAASGTGSCTNQVVTGLNDDAAPTCANVSSAMISDGVISSADLVPANKTLQITYSFFDPANDLPNTLDVPSLFPNRSRAITLTEVYCEINAGSASINLQRDDGSPTNILSSDLACSAAGATTTSFVAGENALAVGHNLDHVTVSVGAGLRRLNLAIKYTVD